MTENLRLGRDVLTLFYLELLWAAALSRSPGRPPRHFSKRPTEKCIFVSENYRSAREDRLSARSPSTFAASASAPPPLPPPHQTSLGTRRVINIRLHSSSTSAARNAHEKEKLSRTYKGTSPPRPVFRSTRRRPKYKHGEKQRQLLSNEHSGHVRN